LTYRREQVCFWHKADVLIALTDARFRGKADMSVAVREQ
jgi:hypothetical protein